MMNTRLDIMNKTKIKEDITIQGFDDKSILNAKVYYLTFIAPLPFNDCDDVEILYVGETADISENLAEKCVFLKYFTEYKNGIPQYSGYKNYSSNNPDDYVIGAKESIKSACPKKYCIIYKKKKKNEKN